MNHHEIHPFTHKISSTDRSAIKRHLSGVIWFTGLSGSGKSTLANEVEYRLHHDYHSHTYLLDGDNIRQGLNADLSFTAEDRRENIRRISEVCRLFADAGLLVLTAFISPFQADRAQARQIINPFPFIEIFVDCALHVCIQRDPKGLYHKAMKGKIENYTGIDSPYEIPANPELRVCADSQTIEEATREIMAYLVSANPFNLKNFVS